MGFTVSAEYRVKLEESEKLNKYVDLARELKKDEEHGIGTISETLIIIIIIISEY